MGKKILGLVLLLASTAGAIGSNIQANLENDHGNELRRTFVHHRDETAINAALSEVRTQNLITGAYLAAGFGAAFIAYKGAKMLSDEPTYSP